MTISLQGRAAALRAPRKTDRRKVAAFSLSKNWLRRPVFDRTTLKIDNGAVNNMVMPADSFRPAAE
jgi:hypothetical protein